MRTARRATLLVLFFVFALTLNARAGQLGADVNADVDAFGHSQMDADSLRAFAQKNTVYPLPMANLPPGDHARYWDTMVEQYQSAQIDFVSVWLKGNGQPATFANLVTALDRRGLSRRIKVMPFDDNAASWTAMWNYDHGNGYNYKVPFDVGDPKNWPFVWDQNVKAFFQNVPDANRYKIKGRPVYAIWSGAPAFLSNLNGNGSKLLNYLRRQCLVTFGFNPYIMVPEEWVKNDPSSDSPAIVDAVYPWFTPVPGPVYSTWKTHTWDGITTGVCIPQFHISNNADPNASTWIVDPHHGETLATGLKNTVGSGGCAMTFIEGFDDYWENTTLWRTRSTDESGHAIDDARTGYDYPNQRINLVRRYGNNPFPLTLKEEAVDCDAFSGTEAGSNQPHRYRNGPIATEETADIGGGDDVCGTKAGESLQWQEVPLEGTVRLRVRVATASSGRRMHFVVDGVPCGAVDMPDTGSGQSWVTVDMGEYRFPRRSVHTVLLVCDTGAVSIHWWSAVTTAIPDGAYQVISLQGGSALRRVPWRIHSLGGNRYSVRPVSLVASDVWRITPQQDGSCAITAAETRTINGLPKILQQEWSFVPLP